METTNTGKDTKLPKVLFLILGEEQMAHAFWKKAWKLLM